LFAWLAAIGATFAGHPVFGTEDALQQGRDVNVGVELRLMQAKASRANFNLGQMFPGCPGQAFGELGRKGELDAGVQHHDDARCAAVVPG